MKSLTLAFALLFFTVAAFAQSNNSDPIYLSTPATSLVMKNQNPILASGQDLSFTGNYARGGGAEGKCGKYHKMKTAGIVLSAVGGGLLITGIALEAIAVNRVATGYGTVNDIGLVGGGAACIVFGVLSAGAGIPLAIIGSVKTRKYCGGATGGRANLNLHSGRNGTGLALNF